MGLSHSLNRTVQNIDTLSSRDRVISTWRVPIKTQTGFPGDYTFDPALHTTLRPKALKIAARHLNTFFGCYRPSILETFAGNGIATNIMRRHFTNTTMWVSTDIDNFACNEQLDAVQAVAKYGDTCNALLMVCPPRNRTNYYPHAVVGDFGDYYSCIDFIEKRGHRGGYIIAIGRMFNSDFSCGMREFLVTHPKLELKSQVVLSNDVICEDNPVAEELLIFSF